MRPINENLREKIVRMLLDGQSGTHIAGTFGISHTTVYRIRRECAPTIAVSKGGRPSKVTARTRRQISRFIASGKSDTAVQAQQELHEVLSISVCVETVRRALRKEGMICRTKVKKPFLSIRH
jgi:transposase